jgi:hypothetical protein
LPHCQFQGILDVTSFDNSDKDKQTMPMKPYTQLSKAMSLPENRPRRPAWKSERRPGGRYRREAAQVV